MKVEVNSQALADAVAWTTRVIDARPASPILAGIRLEAIDGTLQLSAFNYAISARHHIEAGVDESGSILVLGKLLADITKSLPAAKTYLSTDGSTLTITSGKSTFTMQLMPDNEYPDLPVVPAKLGQVDAQTFAQAVAQESVARGEPSGTDRHSCAVPRQQGDHELHRPIPLVAFELHLDAGKPGHQHHRTRARRTVARCGPFLGRASKHRRGFRSGESVAAGL